jgi:hypothetical protein
VRGLAKVRASFVFAMAAYNIVRLPSSWSRRAKCVRRHEKLGNKNPPAGQNCKSESQPPAKIAPAPFLRDRTDFFSSLLRR